MIRIAVCDDELPFANYLAEKIRKEFVRLHIDVDVTVFLDSCDLLCSDVSNTSLYFLDIMMPKISGMELASKILKQNPTARLVFVSSFEETVFESLRYRPLRFIRKEKLLEELPEAIEAFLSAFQNDFASIELHTTTDNLWILLSDLIFVESKAHYLEFHCTQTVHRVRGKLSEYQEILQSHDFIRPGKSFLVNCWYISNFSFSKMELQDGTQINISRDKRENIKSDYMKFARKRLL